MTKFIVKADCGNAPKKLAIRNLNEAFATGDAARIPESVTDDIH